LLSEVGTEGTKGEEVGTEGTMCVCVCVCALGMFVYEESCRKGT
jgi:hypothetical protein